MKAIIFDADYTLYRIRNLREAEEKKFQYLQEKTGIDANELREKGLSLIRELLDQDIRDYVKRSRQYSTVQTLVSFGVDEKKAETLTEEALKIFWSNVTKNLEFNPEIREIIGNLKEKYLLCVASDEFRDNLEMKLNCVFGDWKDYFEFIVTAEDTKELKPSKKFCEIPLEKFGLEPNDVMFVGDSWKRELSVAKEMGLKTILVKEQREGEPDYCIKNLKEILSIKIFFE